MHTIKLDNFNEIVQTKSNDVLLQMVYEFDQWSPSMLASVEQELMRRNILPTDISSKRQDQINMERVQLKAGKPASLFGLVLGWLTVFGLLGIAIGYNYAFSKVKSKFTEETYFKYDESSRRNGTTLFYTSIVLTSLAILFRIIAPEGLNI